MRYIEGRLSAIFCSDDVEERGLSCILEADYLVDMMHIYKRM